MDKHMDEKALRGMECGEEGGLQLRSERNTRIKHMLGYAVCGAALTCLLVVHMPTSNHSEASKVKWTPCTEDPSMFCTVFPVPTDYEDASVGTTYLAMTKIPASKEPRLGSVLTNYGGPGALGYLSSFDTGKRLMHPYALNYDLISWDPRGMGRTTPAVDCYGSALAPLLAKAGTTHEETMDIPSDPFSEAGTAVMVEQQRDAMALMKMQAEKCGERMGEALKYMGTTTLIKDMERINAALEGPEADINLISGSYGSIVAAYLVNMLPHKVGRILTMGIVDASVWANDHYENLNGMSDWLEDSEKTLDWFFQDCFDVGEKCPLFAEGDKGPKDILNRFDHFLDDLYEEPLSVPNGARPGLLKSSMARATLYEVLQMVEFWPLAAEIFANAMEGNGTWLRATRAHAYNPAPAHDGWVFNNQGDLTRLAVSCADSPHYAPGEAWPTPEGVVKRLQYLLKNVSRHFGGTVHLLEQHGGCQYWPKPKKPVERFTGPWNSTLKNPIIIGSNTHDPVTPRSLGKRMAMLFGDKARHFVQDVPGHSYLTPPVSSFLEAVQAYFEKGVLPNDFETFYPAEGKNYFEASNGEKLDDQARSNALQVLAALRGRM